MDLTWIVMSKNQIEQLKEFFKSKETVIIINQVNDEIALLYLNLIQYYSKFYNFKINQRENNESDFTENDLFGLSEIKIYNSANSSKINKFINSTEKKIIFTDYKNFKKLKSTINFIDGYQFENDIKFFVQKELKIDNKTLLSFSINNPILLFSEISKYLVNSQNYIQDQQLYEETNHILNIRKNIFNLKKNSSDIKALYSNIKKEVMYKKFNFLTY